MALLVAGLSVACGTAPRAPSGARPGVVAESFETPRSPRDNVDSLAVWARGRWLFATAKSTDRLLVFDAGTGAPLRAIGSPGDGPGQLRRPNGVAVFDDLCLVVERDNHRVQVFGLPDFEPLGSFGAADLVAPYGLAVVGGDAPGAFTVYVTDNYGETPAGIPPAAELGARVKQYAVRLHGGRVDATLVRSFGDTSGEGVLHVVESIGADPATDRVLIADEYESRHDVKVYTLDGVFTGTVIGRGVFAAEPEGIALLECGDGGWWVATDQRQHRTVFNLFDRRTLRLAGAFTGSFVANTDGIAITGASGTPFGSGALFAVHDDQSVAAFDWAEVVRATGLTACPSPTSR
ncbi:MAG: phytase [Acidobacteriota bacterium]